MPTIYDNIDTDLLRGLRDALTATGARRARHGFLPGRPRKQCGNSSECWAMSIVSS
ncbi:MAG: hypothetical protein OXU96_07365 [Gammaproteobacteria bacterium]|nr:hypothetical protein [Gammaproteobacteria bacterium]